MTYASVKMSEQDNSALPTPFPGLYGAIVLPDAVRGPLGKPILITNPGKLLSAFSIDSTIKPGSSQAYQQAMIYLTRGNKLWAVKPANTGYQVAAVQVNKATATASSTVPAAPVTAPTTYTFTADGLFLVYAASGVLADPGSWGNRLKVLPQSVTRPEFAGHFNLLVYLDSVLMETWKVTRQQVKDGSGNSAYLEDVLKSSAYVSAIDNLAVDPTIMPNFPTGSPATPISLTQGADGTATTAGQIELAYDLFLNKAAYPCTMILDHGDSADSTKLEMISIAEQRGDCIVLGSINYSTMQNPTTFAQDAVTWRTGFNSNSSYAAFYGPTVEIYDKFNDKNIFIGASGYAAASINFTYNNFEAWVPPAGYARGAMLNAIGVQQVLQDGDMALMYDAGLNPIRFTSEGILIWGQKTLSFPPSARDRVNVRMLFCVLKPSIEQYLEGELFNLNLPDERLRIVNKIDNYMSGVQGKGGVYAYETVADNTNNSPADVDNYTLNVLLRLQPAKGMEFINFTMSIDPTGVTYS